MLGIGLRRVGSIGRQKGLSRRGPRTRIIVSDSFTRADATESLGTADTGQAWAGSNNWGIQGNAAAQTSANGNIHALIDCGVSDCTVEVTLSAVNGSEGLALRSSADSTTAALRTNQTALFEMVAGVQTQLGSNFSATFVAGDRIRAVMSGTTINIYRQVAAAGAWTLVGTRTSSVGLTNTRHGMRSSTNTGGVNRMDNFLVTVP